MDHKPLVPIQFVLRCHLQLQIALISDILYIFFCYRDRIVEQCL